MKLGFTKKAFLIIFILALFFLLLNFWGGGALKNLFYNQSLGLQQFFWQKGSALSFNAQDQQALNKNLIAENQKLLSDLADLESFKKENEFLRQALGLGLANNYELIMAEVTAKSNFSFKGISYGDSILINKGSRDGIKKGFPVILQNKILLGKIVDVYPNFSRAILTSSLDSVIDVQIQDSPNFALAKGQGNQKIILDMFPKDQELELGKLVTTSALGGIYPSGMVVGTIGAVNSVDSEPFKKAEISSAYNLNTINKVFIIKNITLINE
jgi:rod shape-determining protein MreC